VGGTPFFAAGGRGSRIVDVNGNVYVDYVGAYGPLVLGHCPERVEFAIRSALENGTAFGAPTEAETRLATLIRQLVPSMQKLRLVNSGTEATMSAIRVARGYTGRDKIIKFNGCYHGHADYLLVKAGSGALTFGQPDSDGVPAGSAADTLVAEFNSIESVKALLEANSGEVAGIILEPVPGNMGVIPPLDGFLEGLRALCDQHETLLIFDEVMSGFRVYLGGAQALFGVAPDLTCLGKVIGGGLPVGAYGGRADVMGCVAPDGPVYQAGTLSGNPLSTAAGIAALEQLSEDGVFDGIVATTRELCEGLTAAAADHQVDSAVQQVGTMFTLFFGATQQVTNHSDVSQCNFEQFNAYFHGMRDLGINLPPSQYEACFVSAAHDQIDIEGTLDAARQVFATL
jgi:glutamate-1-semialdehyde 2,1-aminomutase